MPNTEKVYLDPISRLTVWMIWVAGDDAVWLETAWLDDMTSENPEGWKNEVDRVRKLAYEQGCQMRIQQVKIPGVLELFEIPTAEAMSVDALLP